MTTPVALPMPRAARRRLDGPHQEIGAAGVGTGPGADLPPAPA
ncbi:MAG TPA: hypothetical protein VM367_00465 [Pseudonocardia sp.]|nr:hypothetical protein [Pseudonocardia sp.]